MTGAGEQMRSVHRERREPALPQIVASTLVDVCVLRVASMRLAGRDAQPVGVLRRQDQVNVILHQTISPHLHAYRSAALSQKVAVERVALVAEEHPLPPVVPLRHIMRYTRRRYPRQSRHAPEISAAAAGRQSNVVSPICCPE